MLECGAVNKIGATQTFPPYRSLSAPLSPFPNSYLGHVLKGVRQHALVGARLPFLVQVRLGRKLVGLQRLPFLLRNLDARNQARPRLPKLLQPVAEAWI